MRAEDQINTQGPMQAEDQTDKHYLKKNKTLTVEPFMQRKLSKSDKIDSCSKPTMH